MFLPSNDILKNRSEIMQPYALVLAGTLALKNSLTCISVTRPFSTSHSVFSHQTPRWEITF